MKTWLLNWYHKKRLEWRKFIDEDNGKVKIIAVIITWIITAWLVYEMGNNRGGYFH